jgi:hypothetical protein
MTITTDSHYFICVRCTNCSWPARKNQASVRAIPTGTSVSDWLADGNDVCGHCGCATLVRNP